MSKSAAEEAFAEWMAVESIGGFVREHQFAPPRKWRWDYAWPALWFAVEIQGLTRWGTTRRKRDGREVLALGGHQSADGILKDAEKHAAALIHGWTVFAVPAEWIVKGTRRVWNPLVLQVIRTYVP